MMVGQQHDTLQDRAVGCCHKGCFLFWARRRHRERRRQGTTAKHWPSTASKVEAASSASQGGQHLASLTPVGGTGRPCGTEVAAEAGSNGPQRRQVTMTSAKDSMKLPGVVQSLRDGPLALGPSIDAAGPRLNQGGGCNDRRVAVHAKLNPPVTVAEKVQKEAGRPIAGNIAPVLAFATPAIVTDDKTIDARSTFDEEQVYKDSLCEPMVVLRLAKEAEQEALREMEEAMQLMREVTKRRMEMATKNAKGGHCSSGSNQRLNAVWPADSLGVPPVSSTEAATKELQAATPDLQRGPQQYEHSLRAQAGKAHNDARVGDTEEDALGGPQNAANVPQQWENQDPGNLHSRGHSADASAARPPLQQACGKRRGHQVIPLKSSVHQGYSAASRDAQDYANILEDRKSFHRAMQASRTPQILEEDVDHDRDAPASFRPRRRGAGHTVLLDSSQVVSGSVSCPLASLFSWTCNMCLQEEKVPELQASQLKPING